MVVHAATMRLPLEPRAAVALRRGHPWIWRDALRLPKGGKQPETGDVVSLVEASSGELLGSGLYDASSPIAVRVHVRGPAKLDAGRIAEAMQRAFAKRAPAVADGATDAYRLCNGEGDRVPGFVVDRYGSIAVLRTDGEAASVWVGELAPRLRRALAQHGVDTLLLRVQAGANERKVETLYGPEPPERVVVREHGMLLEVDVLHGQKTGAFLDQRENRRRVRELSRDRKRVLNLYSYTGGFSVAAALGGAAEVTSVDVAGKAHASAQRSFRLNGLDAAAHRFVTADAPTYLAELARRGERFDLVISDPPSFAPNERSVQRALAAYAKLHAACAAVLAEGGSFCAASCSSHVGLEAFLGTLDDAALGRSDLSLLGAFGPPDDHPSLPGFPEGRYLKMAILA